MKPRLSFWTIRRGSVLAVSLIVVLAASACAPAATSAPPPVESVPATATVAAPVSTPLAPTAASVDVQAIATSRGPNLEATDPTTVNLASGQLQLVEFFRFT